MITISILERASAELAEHGYCILRDVLAPELVAQLDQDLAERFAATPFGSGGFYGETTKRFGRLLARSGHAEVLVRHPLVLAIAEAALSSWCDCIQLNTTQAISIHPGAPAQLPHRDQDMWAAPKGRVEYLVNVMWPLTSFNMENGATMIWPGSHAGAALEEPVGVPKAIEMEPGDCLLFLGSALHSAGANRSPSERRGIIVGYSLGWLKPYENQMLAYPPSVARDFAPELAALIGYRQHRPNLGNYEGQCPSVVLSPHHDPDGFLGAVDALRPDQRDLVETMTRPS
jgi:ectoine hydroxylase-related dioxygenase (phytanoyl-CoA dioxygenase family)